MAYACIIEKQVIGKQHSSIGEFNSLAAAQQKLKQIATLHTEFEPTHSARVTNLNATLFVDNLAHIIYRIYGGLVY